MISEETGLMGCLVLEPKLFKDGRGYFFESYNRENLQKALGQDVNFVQDNESRSTYGVIRGLHYQTGDFAQAKLVRVLEGKVLDVAVDLRKGSPSFGKHFTIELSSENKRQLFIPRGFAHGFSVLSARAVFFYKCDNYYKKENEAGIHYKDPDLDIDWKIPDEKIIVSEKDLVLPDFKNAVL